MQWAHTLALSLAYWLACLGRLVTSMAREVRVADATLVRPGRIMASMARERNAALAHVEHIVASMASESDAALARLGHISTSMAHGRGATLARLRHIAASMVRERDATLARLGYLASMARERNVASACRRMPLRTAGCIVACTEWGRDAAIIRWGVTTREIAE